MDTYTLYISICVCVYIRPTICKRLCGDDFSVLDTHLSDSGVHTKCDPDTRIEDVKKET